MLTFKTNPQHNMAKGETYEQFVNKFKPPKTPDDCYTPPEVYEAVRDFVDAHVVPLEGTHIVRPFRPGGDYQGETYPEGCLVLDNPPFSILASIVDWYRERGIRFFLFAPQLTLMGYGARPDVTCVVAGGKIVYENGASVVTSFVTNVWPGSPAFVVRSNLCQSITKASERALKDRVPPRNLPRRRYPPHVCTAATLGKLATHGVNFTAPRAETQFVRKLDCGTALFGSGFLLSERLAAERLAAERLAAERQLEYETLTLSPRERAIIAALAAPEPPEAPAHD